MSRICVCSRVSRSAAGEKENNESYLYLCSNMKLVSRHFYAVCVQDELRIRHVLVFFFLPLVSSQKTHLMTPNILLEHSVTRVFLRFEQLFYFKYTNFVTRFCDLQPGLHIHSMCLNKYFTMENCLSLVGPSVTSKWLDPHKRELRIVEGAFLIFVF